jgi:uncharacterized cupin superfamily protein
MAGHTIVNLNDVEDMGPKFGYAPNLQARFVGSVLGLEKSGLSFQRLAPNFRMPFGHKHKQQEEVYVVVRGSGRLKLDDEIVDVKELDVVRVPGEVMRAFEAGSDGIEVLAFGAPSTGPPQEDAEMQPGWWDE